jgi:hypothetical protein
VWQIIGWSNKKASFPTKHRAQNQSAATNAMIGRTVIRRMAIGSDFQLPTRNAKSPRNKSNEQTYTLPQTNLKTAGSPPSGPVSFICFRFEVYLPPVHCLYHCQTTDNPGVPFTGPSLKPQGLLSFPNGHPNTPPPPPGHGNGGGVLAATVQKLPRYCLGSMMLKIGPT